MCNAGGCHGGVGDLVGCVFVMVVCLMVVCVMVEWWSV